MKTMRSALLAAGIVAALITSAHAQVVLQGSDEFSFTGQVELTDFVVIPVTANGGNPPLVVAAAQDLQALGRIDSGNFTLPGPVYTNGLELFPGPGSTDANAVYTFTLTGLSSQNPGGQAPTAVRNPANSTEPPGETIISTRYTGGTFTIYQANPLGISSVPNAQGEVKNAAFPADPAVPIPPRVLGATYATSSGYNVGNIFLQGSVNVDATFSVSDAGGSFITTTFSDLIFTGGSLYNNFLLPNNFLAGRITGTTSVGGAFATLLGPGGVPTQAGLVTNGQINVIPEPTTIALFGTGLLPLGMFLRRRRA